jgi:hypothetical protein
VATDDHRACCRGALGAPAQDRDQDLGRELVLGVGENVERSYRSSTHREDVAHRVGGADLAERVRIVDQRRKEVDGIDDRQIVLQAIDPGVVVAGGTGEQTRIGLRWKLRQNARQVTRTQLGGSTTAAKFLGQLYRWHLAFRHARSCESQEASALLRSRRKSPLRMVTPPRSK